MSEQQFEKLAKRALFGDIVRWTVEEVKEQVWARGECECKELQAWALSKLWELAAACEIKLGYEQQKGAASCELVSLILSADDAGLLVIGDALDKRMI
jgi:hypothetical protein